MLLITPNSIFPSDFFKKITSGLYGTYSFWLNTFSYTCAEMADAELYLQKHVRNSKGVAQVGPGNTASVLCRINDLLWCDAGC